MNYLQDMQMNRTIPFLSLASMLRDLQYHWHSDDYYISPDEVINEPHFTDAFRPDFYALILGTQGWMDLMVNGERVRISEFTFFAGGPNMVVQRMGKAAIARTKRSTLPKHF